MKRRIIKKNSMPINLNDKTELFLTSTIKNTFKNLSLDPKNTIIISGDAHVQSMNQGKFFKYYKVPAMSPSSDWVKANYGQGVEGIQDFTLFENKFETGVIEF